MEKSCDTNTFQISPPVALDKLGHGHPLVQTFLPVYRDFQNARTAESRRTCLCGYLVGLCQVDDLVEQACNTPAARRGSTWR